MASSNGHHFHTRAFDLVPIAVRAGLPGTCGRIVVRSRNNGDWSTARALRIAGRVRPAPGAHALAMCICPIGSRTRWARANAATASAFLADQVDTVPLAAMMRRLCRAPGRCAPHSPTRHSASRSVRDAAKRSSRQSQHVSRARRDTTSGRRRRPTAPRPRMRVPPARQLPSTCPAQPTVRAAPRHSARASLPRRMRVVHHHRAVLRDRARRTDRSPAGIKVTTGFRDPHDASAPCRAFPTQPCQGSHAPSPLACRRL